MRRPTPILVTSLAAAAVLGACQYGIDLPPQVTLSPPPGPFNETVEVTLTVDSPGTIHVTSDGSDPTLPNELRVSGEGSVKVVTDRTVTLKFVSQGGDQSVFGDVQEATYERAGGRPGSASGVIVTGDVVVGHRVALSFDGNLAEYPAPTAPARIPFSFSGLADGTYRLQALADRDDDGNFLPFLDIESESITFTIDRSDPYKASAEDLVLYLGASASGRCTIYGNVTLADANTTALVNISALSPEALTGAIGGGGGGGNPGDLFGGLLGTLLGGDQLFADGSTGRYPYVLQDLEPGTYIPLPALISFDAGLGINLLANILNPVDCGPGQVKRADFRFGPVSIDGRVSVTGNVSAGQFFTLGTVAARSSTLGAGIQAVLMPANLVAAEGGGLTGTYSGKGLRDFANVSLRVFTGTGGSFGLDSLLGALVWAINPLSQEQPDLRLQTQDQPVTQDLTVVR